MRGVRLTAPLKGETVAVVGLGLIGNFSARIFNSSGTKVYAFDLSERVEIARQAGIEAHVISGSLVESGRKVLPGGTDIVVDCTGAAAVTSQAMELAKDLPCDDSAGNGPRFVFQGSLAGNVLFPYHLCFNLLYRGCPLSAVHGLSTLFLYFVHTFINFILLLLLI